MLFKIRAPPAGIEPALAPQEGAVISILLRWVNLKLRQTKVFGADLLPLSFAELLLNRPLIIITANYTTFKRKKIYKPKGSKCLAIKISALREKAMIMTYKGNITVLSVCRDEAFFHFVRTFFLTTLCTLFAFQNSTLCGCYCQFLHTRKN